MGAIKKGVVNVLAFRFTSQGFIGAEAKKWVRKSYRFYFRNKDYSFGEVRWALKHGFMPDQVRGLNITSENIADTISAKDYAFLRPLNGGYSKWISNKITIDTIFKPYRDHLTDCYFQISKRYAETQVIPLRKDIQGDSIEDILEFVKEKGKVRLRKTGLSRRSRLIEYRNGHYYYSGNVIDRGELAERLESFKTILVVTEEIAPKKEFDGAVLKLIIFNEQGDNPVIGDSYITYRLKSQNKALLLDDNEMEDSPKIENQDEEEVETLNSQERVVSLKNEDEIEALYDEDETSAASDDDGTEEQDELNSLNVYAYVDAETGQIGEGVSFVDGNRVANNKNPNNDIPLSSSIECWQEIQDTVDSLCRFVPQLEFFGMNIVLTDDGSFKIISMINHPSYPRTVPFSKKTVGYLRKKVEQKKAAYKGAGIKIKRGAKKIKLKVRATYAKAFFPADLKPYLSIRWFQDVRHDFFTNKDTTLREKFWAIKHGFLSYRLHQYGITPENHLNYISDFEYKWLRHINNRYRHWMEDKITVKYVCSEFNDCFPEYYYHISLKNGNNKVIPMMDLDKKYGNNYDDIFKLVQEKGALALKPDEGSHGDGFYKLSYEDGKYYLNREEATEQDVLNILEDVKNQYLVTEYIDMHHEIKNIYDGAVNTIRMIVFKKDGKNPEIGNAYMRFGSKRTGAVDNMGAGGMFAKIDIETGRFYDAKIIENNEIKTCLNHPDTGVKIEGILPNWEKVKSLVLDVARDIPQLEYFGFDLALTETGLKFPEINRFPDYPAIEKYSDKTIDYLLYKLEQKKKLYGYDKSRGHKLVKLPKR